MTRKRNRIGKRRKQSYGIISAKDSDEATTAGGIS
jgi:hypothetical protein